MARRKIAGILCVFQDFSTRPAAILAVKLGAEAIGTASKVYCLSPDRISTESFQEYGRCFSLLELTKESCDETDIYTAVFRETEPLS